MSHLAPADNNLKRIFVVTLIGTTINFFLGIIKIFVGLRFHVDAVLADGIQSLADMISDVLLLVAVTFSYKPRSRAQPFGHRRLETLVTLCIAMVLILTAYGLARRAFYAPDSENFTLLPALIISVVAAVIKELLFHYTIRKGKKLKSPAVVANSWSHRADAMSSAAVAVCIILGMLFGNFPLWDKIGVVIVCILILKAAWNIGRDGLAELLDHAPSEDLMIQVENLIDQDPDVVFVHNVRVRSVAGTLDISCTIEINGNLTVNQGADIARRVEERLFSGFEGVAGVMIRIMPAGNFAAKALRRGIENVPREDLV
ncbi:cation diffusion facilitator family transporter [Desulfonatronum parangueonense]